MHTLCMFTPCTFYNADFLIYSSMASFYVPCVIMTVLYGRIFRAIRRRERKTKTTIPSSASSAAAARRLSCVGGGTVSLLPPTTSAVVPTPQPGPACRLEEATVARVDGCSSVVVDAPRSPPPRTANPDYVVVRKASINELDDDGRRQQALPILLLPSGESPRNDDSFEIESDRVLAMLPTPYVPSTKVRCVTLIDIISPSSRDSTHRAQKNKTQKTPAENEKMQVK